MRGPRYVRVEPASTAAFLPGGPGPAAGQRGFESRGGDSPGGGADAGTERGRTPMQPHDEQAFDVPADDRAAIRAALKHAQGFLLVGDLHEERAKAERIQEALDETAETEPVTLREVDAARAVAALVAYRGHLLDEDEVADAAKVEEAIRTFAAQNAALAEMTEAGR